MIGVSMAGAVMAEEISGADTDAIVLVSGKTTWDEVLVGWAAVIMAMGMSGQEALVEIQDISVEALEG